MLVKKSKHSRRVEPSRAETIKVFNFYYYYYFFSLVVCAFNVKWVLVATRKIPAANKKNLIFFVFYDYDFEI